MSLVLSDTNAAQQVDWLNLPLEIIEQSIGFLKNDKQALRMLCLVSKAFRALAQPALFKEISFFRYRRNFTLLEVLQANPHLNSYIHNFSVTTDAIRAWHDWSTLIKHIASTCSNLRHFGVEFRTQGPFWAEFEQMFDNEDVLGIKSLRSLYLAHFTTENLFAKLYNTAIALKELDIWYLASENSHLPSPNNLLPHPHLQKMVLKDANPDLIIELLNSCSSSLRHLEFESHWKDLTSTTSILPLVKLERLHLWGHLATQLLNLLAQQIRNPMTILLGPSLMRTPVINPALLQIETLAICEITTERDLHTLLSTPNLPTIRCFEFTDPKTAQRLLPVLPTTTTHITIVHPIVSKTVTLAQIVEPYSQGRASHLGQNSRLLVTHKFVPRFTNTFGELDLDCSTPVQIPGNIIVRITWEERVIWQSD